MIAGLLQLVLRDLWAARLRGAVSCLGIALGVAVLTVLVALGLGVRELVLREVVRELPVDMIEVMPRSIDLGLFALRSDVLSGRAGLDDATLARLRGLEGVAKVFPKREVPLPLGASGGGRLFGRRLYTDLFMTALPEELIAEEVGVGFVDTPEVVPVVISKQLIDIYNISVAPTLGTPQLTPSTLTGFEFDIIVGKSLLLGGRGARQQGRETARIVGASRYAMRLGVTVPLATAERLLATFGQGDAQARRYASALVRARSAAEVPVVVAGVERLNLAVDETASHTRDMMTMAIFLASTVGLLVLLLAALTIAHGFFVSLQARQRELGILRAVGASGRHLVCLVLCQAALLGLLGGLLGLLLAALVAWGLDALALGVGHFPFKPASFFLFPPDLLLAAVASAVAAAVAGALWPALRVARLPVTKTLE